MRYSKKYNFIYLANCKTGSTSIRDLLINNVEDVRFNMNELKKKNRFHDHFPAREFTKIFQENGDDFSKYFSFTVIRNPYDRTVSAYSYQKCDKNGLAFWNYDKYDNESAGSLSFEEYLDINGAGYGINNINYFAYDENGFNLLTKIYTIENFSIDQLNKDINEFNNNKYPLINLPDELKKMNQTIRNSDYKYYFKNDKYIKLINDYFYEDIRLGNYIF